MGLTFGQNLLIFIKSHPQKTSMRKGFKMNYEEKELLRKVLTYIMIARNSDHITHHALMDGETFRTEVLLPLMAMAEWSEADQAEVNKEIREFSENSRGKTLHEKSEMVKSRISKKWKIGAAGIGIAGIAGAALYLLKKNRK